MDAHGVEAAETVPASRKLGRDEAREILLESTEVWVAKGKRVERIEVDQIDSEELLGRFLGPTGNLRAPTARAGKTVLVGFHEDSWGPALLAGN